VLIRSVVPATGWFAVFAHRCGDRPDTANIPIAVWAVTDHGVVGLIAPPGAGELHPATEMPGFLGYTGQVGKETGYWLDLARQYLA